MINKGKIVVNEKNLDIIPIGKENVKKVLDVIKKNKLKAEVLAHPDTKVTNLQIHLDLYGGTPEQVMKCLCMVSKNKPLVVIASGEIKIDTDKLSKFSGLKDIRMATKEELEKLFGRMPGAVDPLTIPKEINVFADKKFFGKEYVVGSAGSPCVGLKINPKEILKVRKIEVADLAEDNKNTSDIDKKIGIIKSFAEEIIQEDELRELFRSKKQIIAYDGFEPSGNIHIAQGLMRAITVNKLTSLGIKFRFWVADWFGMLNNKFEGDLNKIRIVGEYFIEVWKACGLDMKNVEFIWTSDFIKQHPEYWETVLKLSMHASVQRVLRCSQIMGREDSINNPAAQILYPLMQAADIHHLEADIAQLGLDQRKVNMLAREIFPKLGFKPPVVISHHMLLGLQFTESNLEGTDRKIAMKMSKSKPDTAIFMTDTKEDVFRKFSKAYCPEGQEQDNPVLEYAKYIVFEKYNKIIIERPAKFGGNLEVKSYEELRDLFVDKKIHPMDLKNTIAKYINELLEPIRNNFEKNKKARELKEKVESFKITR